jgi:hypothetical protein
MKLHHPVDLPLLQHLKAICQCVSKQQKLVCDVFGHIFQRSTLHHPLMLADLAGAGPSSPSYVATSADLAGPTSSPLHGFKLAYLGVSKGEEFSPLFGAGPHFVVPEADLAAADLLGLSTM